ncbi:MAG: type II toxin-antitoxin system YafQ family toxin [Clostridia bacterium]
MKYDIKMSTKFKKDYKLILKRGYDIKLLHDVIDLLVNDEELPEKYKDHALIGDYKGCRECHITPDWLLIYRLENDVLILGLTRTGSHSDLF